MNKILIYKIIAILGIVFLTSCNKRVLYIYSPQREQCITIITKGKIRYIINGKHEEVPEKNYLKLDISNTTTLSDAIYICWYQQNKTGEIVMPKVKVLENMMDPDFYKFSDHLPEDKNGVPRPTKFGQLGCTSVGFSYQNPYPKGSSIVE